MGATKVKEATPRETDALRKTKNLSCEQSGRLPDSEKTLLEKQKILSGVVTPGEARAHLRSGQIRGNWVSIPASQLRLLSPLRRAAVGVGVSSATCGESDPQKRESQSTESYAGGQAGCTGNRGDIPVRGKHSWLLS